MDLFDTLTWAEILVKTTFLGTPTLTVPNVFQETKSLCVEEAPMHMLIVWFFNTTILEMSYLLSKNGL
jgi:hypothetical protein